METDKITTIGSHLVKVKKWSDNNGLAEVFVYQLNKFGIKFSITTNFSEGNSSQKWLTPEEFYETYEVLIRL